MMVLVILPSDTEGERLLKSVLRELNLTHLIKLLNYKLLLKCVNRKVFFK